MDNRVDNRVDNRMDNRVDNLVDNLADKGAPGIHKKVRNLNTIKSEVHFQLFGISPSCMANLMMIKTFHYYKFWVSFLNMLFGQSKKSFIFHTHLN